MTSFINSHHTHGTVVSSSTVAQLEVCFTTVRHEHFSLFHFDVLLCLPLKGSGDKLLFPLCPSVCPSIRPSVCLSVCLSACLSVRHKIVSAL